MYSKFPPSWVANGILVHTYWEHGVKSNQMFGLYLQLWLFLPIVLVNIIVCIFSGLLDRFYSSPSKCDWPLDLESKWTWTCSLCCQLSCVRWMVLFVCFTVFFRSFWLRIYFWHEEPVLWSCIDGIICRLETRSARLVIQHRIQNLCTDWYERFLCLKVGKCIAWSFVFAIRTQNWRNVIYTESCHP